MDKILASATKAKPGSDARGGEADQAGRTRLPNGVVLGKDGKPCRSCTSVRDWMAMTRTESSSSSSTASASSAAASSAATAASALAATPPTQKDCPPDVDRLGRHTWTLLHSLSATYPASASPQQQSDMRSFLGLFARLYPCWVCAEDFEAWMGSAEGKPRLKGRDDFGSWMCEAHNEVNRKLGKKEFDCKLWKERWADGWRDGSCG